MTGLLARYEAVDTEALYVHVPRPAPEDRPWVVINMITSVDAASSVSGRSGALGDTADREVFRLLRSAADVVLVAAGTARTENYGPVKLDAGSRAQRAAAGRTQVPPVAVVSAKLSVDPESALFAEAEPPTILITTASAKTDRFSDRSMVVRAGDSTVDLAAALRALREAGHELVVCEGGPSLNAALLSAGLVDELCLTVAPMVVANGSKFVYGSPSLPDVRLLHLAHVLASGDHLLVRYVFVASED